jgi:hypothetical protein
LFGHGKLRSNLEGSYLVINATDHNAITLQDDDGNVFKANGQRLKIFLEPEIPEFEEIDVTELPKLIHLNALTITIEAIRANTHIKWSKMTVCRVTSRCNHWNFDRNNAYLQPT